jgi:mono/diheme cytochrome c family protein
VAVVALVGACGPQTRAEKVAALTGTAAAGKLVYDAYCSSCHGSNGTGTSSGVNLVSALEKPSATFIGKIIDGVPGTGMASYATLTDQQLADVYAHLKTLR